MAKGWLNSTLWTEGERIKSVQFKSINQTHIIAYKCPNCHKIELLGGDKV